MTNHSKQTLDSVDAAAALEEQAVLAPIQALVDSVAKRDKKAMLDVLLPDGATTVIRNGQVFQFNLRGLVDRLPAGTRRIEERIYDPLIRIDNDIAMVWARYEFLIDGQVVQYGTDLFNLIHYDERWLIAGVAYNSRHAPQQNVDA
jgi:hypothetical protein